MRRRRFQFSLRALILTVLIGGPVLGWVGKYVKAEWDRRKRESEFSESCQGLPAGWEKAWSADGPFPYRTHGQKLPEAETE